MTLSFTETYHYYSGAFTWHFIFAICKINDLINSPTKFRESEHITLLFY